MILAQYLAWETSQKNLKLAEKDMKIRYDSKANQSPILKADIFVGWVTKGRIWHMVIWERIWEKGPIGNFSHHEIAEKLLFQMLQTILKYSW